jgi:branched-chain amino acid transport system substrate-binding protein
MEKAVTKIQSIIVAVIVVVALIAGAAYYIISFPPTTKQVLKIGIIYPKTGIYSSLGPWVLDAAMLAIEDYGLVLGAKPEVYVRDDGTDVSTAVSMAKELITQVGVHIIIGEINTPVNNAIAQVCDEYKVPFLYPSGGSIFMSGIGKDLELPTITVKANPHPFMFYTWLNPIQYAFGNIEAAKIYGTRIYFIASDYEFGREAVGYAQKVLKEEFGDKYVNLGESWPKQGEVDYSDAIAKAMAAKPDMVFVCVPGRYTQFQSQAHQAGLDKIAHIHWAYAEDPSARALGEAAYGVTAITDYTIVNPDVPKAEEFARRFYNRYAYWPGWPAHPAYAGTTIFLMAVDKAGSLDPVKIMRAIEGISNPNSITGQPYYIRAQDHKSIQPIYLVKWTKSETPGIPDHWEIIAKHPHPELAHLPDEYTARYDQMTY